MYRLIKALSNMYDESSVSNMVFFVRKLVNTKLKEGMFATNLVIQFNAILSPLDSVDIKFVDEVQAFLLLSLLPRVGMSMLHKLVVNLG